MTSLFSSFMLHVLILVALGLSVNFSAKKVDIGHTKNLVIHSYLWRAAAKASAAAMPAAPKKSILKALNNVHHSQPVVAHHSRLIKKQFRRVAQSAAQKSESQHGQPHSALIALLHAAIQQQQQYPIAALQMEREGRVTVAFVLHPNGRISELRIAKPSGTSSLDEAALAAVQNAVPFQQVEAYLHESQAYSIDVVFELT